MATLASLVVNLTAETAQFRSQMDRASRQTQQQFASMQKAATSLKHTVTGLLGVFSAGIAIREYARLSDEFTNMNSRVRLATNGAREHKNVLDELIRISTTYGQSLSAQAQLFTRLSTGTKLTVQQQKEFLVVNEALSASMRISGATAQEAASASLQLAQALGTGRFAGEEFKAVFEAAPVFMKTLADNFETASGSIGVTTAELYELREAGEITTERVIAAMARGLENLTEKAREVAPTFATATTNIRTGLMLVIGAFNETTDAGGVLIAGLNAVASGLLDLARVLNSQAFQAGFSGVVNEWSRSMSEFSDRVSDGWRLIVSETRSGVRDMDAQWGSFTSDMETDFQGGIDRITRAFQLGNRSWAAIIASIPEALEAAVETMVLYFLRLMNAAELVFPRIQLISRQAWNGIKAFTLNVMASIEESVINSYNAILRAIGQVVQRAGAGLQPLARNVAGVSETMARGIEDTSIALQRMGRDMGTTERHVSDLRQASSGLVSENERLVVKTEELNAQYDRNSEILNEMIASTWDDVDATQANVDARINVVEAISQEVNGREDLNAAVVRGTESAEKEAKATKEKVTELEKAAEAYEDLVDGIEETERTTERMLALIRDENLSREQAATLIEVENAAREANKAVTAEQRDEILAMVAATEKNQEAIGELTKETETGTSLMEESWKTLQNNIQNLFSDTFKDLFTGAFEGWRGLLDKMWRLFAEFAANIAAQRIAVALGLIPVAGAASAAGAGGDLLGLAGQAGGLFNGGLLNGLSGLLGLGGGATGITGIIGGSASTAAGVGGGLSSLAGSSFGVGGGGSGWLATVGAALPWVAAAAGVLALVGGSLFESTPPRAYVIGDFAGGEVEAIVEKKGQDAAALIELFNSITESGNQFIESIGGSLDSGSGQLDLHINPDRLRFTFRLADGGKIETDVDPEDAAAVTDAISRTVLAAASQADFSGAIEEIGAFFNAFSLQIIESLPQGAAEKYIAALGALAQALDTDPLTIYQQALEQQTGGILGAMERQAAGLSALSMNFDGSADQTVALAQSLVGLQQSAVAAIAQIEAARQSVAQTVGGALDQINTDLMTQQEQLQFWLDRATQLQEELAQATDPAVIESLARETTAALLSAWRLMDEDRRTEEADFIRQFLGNIDETAATGLDNAATSVQEIWQSAADEVRSALGEAAAQLSAAATAIRNAIPDRISVDVDVNVRGPGEGGGRARGGFVHAASGFLGGPGMVGGDTIPIMAGAGEAVLNRHQQRFVETALMDSFGFGLQGLFSRESRAHSAPMFQSGGFVAPSPGGNTDGLQRTLDKLADAIMRASSDSRQGSRELSQAARDLPRRIVVELPAPSELTVR